MKPTKVVQSGEVGIAVYAWGRRLRGRPVVVLVHGYPDSAEVWRSTAEHLAKDFYVVAYDVRGAGQSTRPLRTADYALTLLVEDLAAVIEAMSPQKAVHLVAHDWGSIQSWEAVATAPSADRIASFTSISGPSLDHVGQGLRQTLARRGTKRAGAAARQALHSWYIGALHVPGLAPGLWSLGFDRLWPKLLAGREGISGARASTTQRADGRAGVQLYRANVVERLRRPRQRTTAIPVQLLVPLRDRYVTPAMYDDLVEWAPKLWRRDIDAGHWLPLSHPRQIAEWVAEFVGHVEGAPESPALERARRAALARGRGWVGRLVVVTGAASGIGRETALRFAGAGADVVVVDLDPKGAETTAEAIRALGVAAHVQSVDVGNADQMEALARWVASDLGVPDVVVNNAGIGMSGPMLKMSTQDWERILNVNLWGVIHGARLFGRQMVAAGKRGHIVNVSSGLAFFPTRITPAYNTTKAAVQMLSECLRAELSDQGIGVSTIYPGVVDTAITGTSQFIGKDAAGEQRERERAKRLYRRRNLKPSAVAAAIFLAVENNAPEVRVGMEVHALRYLTRFAPGLARRLAAIDSPA